MPSYNLIKQQAGTLCKIVTERCELYVSEKFKPNHSYLIMSLISPTQPLNQQFKKQEKSLNIWYAISWLILH